MSSDGPKNLGAIIGGSIGAVAAIVLLGILAYFFRRQRNAEQNRIELAADTIPRYEMDPNSRPTELSGDAKVLETDGSPIVESGGSELPNRYKVAELGGHGDKGQA